MFQIVFPIFGLATVNFLKAATIANIEVFANMNIAVPIPFVYSVPLKPLSNFPDQSVFNVTQCLEWYMYAFGPETNQEDRDYFGTNTGLPNERKGMLQDGLLTTPCNEIGRNVPYFEELPKWGNMEFNETMNEYVDRHFHYISLNPVNVHNKNEVVDGTELIPDGMIKVERASKEQFNYTLSINDVTYF
jgi:hypothetical protein